jgi:hypothetical protein
MAMLARANLRAVQARFSRSEGGRYRGEVVVRLERGSDSKTVQIPCKHERDTATEAFADAETLAKHYLTHHSIAFYGARGVSSRWVGFESKTSETREGVPLG